MSDTYRPDFFESIVTAVVGPNHPSLLQITSLLYIPRDTTDRPFYGCIMFDQHGNYCNFPQYVFYLDFKDINCVVIFNKNVIQKQESDQFGIFYNKVLISSNFVGSETKYLLFQIRLMWCVASYWTTMRSWGNNYITQDCINNIISNTYQVTNNLFSPM